MLPSLNIKLPGRRRPDVVGLDIQPGLVAAVHADVNGSILARRAAIRPLGADLVREGEVADVEALGDALRDLFANSGLGKRVRIGVANQRTVMRTIELPPVTDHKELAAAVRFQAQDQLPMPLTNAVLDFHPLGIVDTPAGPRQRVVLVAAQRDMIERLLAAVRHAGLRADGVDLSAFALIRALYRRDDEHAGRVLYLNVDGLTNLAIAEGTVCRFTRVVGGGMEAMASELAERRGIALTEARALLAAVDLTAPAIDEHDPLGLDQAPYADPLPATPRPESPEHHAPHFPAAELEVGDADDAGEALYPASQDPRAADFESATLETHDADAPDTEAHDVETHDVEAHDVEAHDTGALDIGALDTEALDTEMHDTEPLGTEPLGTEALYPQDAAPLGVGDMAAREASMSYSETIAAPVPPTPASRPVSDADVRLVLENGIREIAGEVRNSLEFHRTQEDGGEVSRVVLSGSAVDIPGFAEALEVSLGSEVHAESVKLADASLAGEISIHRLAVAAGLAALEAHQ
jgi:type IV pilus assembly protein PilM